MLLWGIHVVRGKRQSVKSCRAFFISDVTGIPEFNIFFKTVENKKKKKRGGLVVARLPSFFLVFSYKQYTFCNFFEVEGNKTKQIIQVDSSDNCTDVLYLDTGTSQSGFLTWGNSDAVQTLYFSALNTVICWRAYEKGKTLIFETKWFTFKYEHLTWSLSWKKNGIKPNYSIAQAFSHFFSHFHYSFFLWGWSQAIFHSERANWLVCFSRSFVEKAKPVWL